MKTKSEKKEAYAFIIIIIVDVNRRVYLNLSTSTQRPAGLNALKPSCCQWALLNVQISTLLFTFTVVQMHIYPAPVSKVSVSVLGLFVFP